MIKQLKSNTSLYDIINSYGIKIQRNGMCVCPFHGENNASMKIYANNTFYCFGCGANGDAIDFVRLMENCDIKKACEIIKNSSFVHYTFTEPKKKILNVDYRKYLIECNKKLCETDYFAKRGINQETQQRFLLGYDDKYKSVTIPYNRRLTYYQSRAVYDKKFYKPSVETAGKEPLFNGSALFYNDKVFVVESPIDAISIMQFNYPAIATCGTQGWKKIPMTNAKLLINFDNDDAGYKAAELLRTNLGGEIVNVADECKDANELLLEDRKRFINNLDNVYKNIV